jgi:hypothetical protein
VVVLPEQEWEEARLLGGWSAIIVCRIIDGTAETRARKLFWSDWRFDMMNNE